MLFDSHAHLNDARFDDDRSGIISAFHADGVGKILECAADMSSLQSVSEISKNDNIYAAYGVHPHSAKDVLHTDYLDTLKEYLSDDKCVAVGEIGLDYFYDNSPKDAQKEILTEQLDLAIALNKPVVLHVRDAYGDALEILQIYAKKGTRGILHCYSGSAELALELIKLGFYFGFGGTLTYKNARKTIGTAQVVPLDRILIETDCPYLAPVPMRGKRNQPKFVRFPCQKLATIKNMSFEDMANLTYQNACELFDIRPVPQSHHGQ